MKDDAIGRWLANEVRPKQALYDALGVFTHKFGTVDLRLTRLHAHLIECRNFEVFADEIAFTLTAGARVQRLMKTAKRTRPLGLEFSRRLKIYSDVVQLRNQLMHNEVTVQGEEVQLISLDRYEADDGEGTVRPSARPQIKMQIADLVAVSFWLDAFADDVAALADKIWDTEAPVEIDQYRSSETPPFELARLDPRR